MMKYVYLSFCFIYCKGISLAVNKFRILSSCLIKHFFMKWPYLSLINSLYIEEYFFWYYYNYSSLLYFHSFAFKLFITLYFYVSYINCIQLINLSWHYTVIISIFGFIAMVFFFLSYFCLILNYFFSFYFISTKLEVMYLHI